jgi:hypothetical protein
MSVQDLDQLIERALPVFVVGDEHPDNITLTILERYSLWVGQTNDNVYPGNSDDEVLNYLSRNVEAGSVYALDEDDWLRQAGFTHHLRVNDPLHDDNSGLFYVKLS